MTPSTKLSRRSIVRGSAGLALGSIGLAACANQDSAAKPDSLGVDLGLPEDNVYAIVKIQGDVSGAPTYFWGQGNVFGVTDAAMAKAMLRYQSARVGRYFKQDDGSYIFRYRGVIVYQDYDTGEYIDEYVNPYTRETVKVNHYITSIGEFSYTTKGPKSAKAFKGNSGKPYGSDYVLPWLRAGDALWVMLDERVEYERPRDKVWRRDNAILRYETKFSEVDDPNLTSASASSSFQTHIDWFTWLNMPGHSGGLMQGGMGKKFGRLDDLPQDFTDFCESKFPGALSAPITKV